MEKCGGKGHITMAGREHSKVSWFDAGAMLVPP